MEIKSYRDLRVWQSAMELLVTIYRLTGSYPKQETYGLVSQMRRAATQIPSKIADGHSREHLRDYLSKIHEAIAILADLQTSVEASGLLGYIDEERVQETLRHTESLGKQLYALRNALLRG